MKKVFLLLIVFVIMLIGCSNPKQQEPVTLKVLYYSTDEFMSFYGKAYMAKNEHISFDVFPLKEYQNKGLSDEQYMSIIEKEQPDIMFDFNYDYAVNEGKLLNLDSYIKDKNFNLEGITPYLLDYLKLHGNGNIYALSPNFTGKAIYYNRAIFDQLGMPYPIDGMEWEDLFQLASQIQAQNNSDTISFYYNDTLFGLIEDIAATMNVHYIDDSGEVTFNTESWRYIFNMVKDITEKGVIQTRHSYDEFSPFTSHPFVSGSVALTIDYTYLIDDLRASEFEWGVSTIPTNKLQESVYAIQPSHFIGINANSNHIEESVEFVKYINSEQYAKINQASSHLSVLPTREQFSKDIIDVDLHPFYSIRPAQDTRNFPFNTEQYLQLNNEIDSILSHAFVSNEMSIDEILEQLQVTVELILMNNK